MHFHNWRLLLIFKPNSLAFAAEQLIKPVFETHLSARMCLHLCPAMCQGKSKSVTEVHWDTPQCTHLLSGMDACREGLLWACVFLCAWQRTSCISPEQHRAHTLTSAVALTNLNLTWPGSPTSLLKSGANWRNEMCRAKTWWNGRMSTTGSHKSLDGDLQRTCGCVFLYTSSVF